MPRQSEPTDRRSLTTTVLRSSRFTLPRSSRAIRWDLGIPGLLRQWRALLTKRFLLRDTVAGITVAFVAVPLSMAIALASDVPPAAGLVTAIVAGALCAVFGGAPLGVSGPAAAMAVLVASIVEDHGMGGLVAASLIAGALQLLTGLFGLGRIARLVPLPVIAGFTAGIGVVILVGQLPRVLGLPPPDQAHVVDVLTHIQELIEHAVPAAVALAVGTLAIVMVSARISPLVPGHLLAVVLATLAASVFALDVELVGPLPESIVSVPAWPPAIDDWQSLLGNAFVLYALASLETLLSCNAVDRLAKTAPHDSDQELVGQGIGTVTSVMLGGVPATSVIARSSLNVAAGGRTRRSALIHAIVVALIVVVFAPLMALMPIPALAGILLAVALRMISVREFVHLWRTSRSEGVIYLLTLSAMVAFDLVAGVQVGLAIAFVIAAVRLGRTDARVMTHNEAGGPYRLALAGPLTFMGLDRIDSLRARLSELDARCGAILDMREVPTLDVTALDAFVGLLEDLERRGFAFSILQAGRGVPEALESADEHGRWSSRLVATEAEAMQMLGSNKEVEPFDRLVEGVDRFRNVARQRYRGLFDRLAENQSPHTLFVTCSDSRVSPLLMTGTEPGEVFIHRNIGNIVPKSGSDGMPAEGAAVEYAVGVLGVKQIIICGHSNCGAMNAIRSGPISPELPSVAAWLEDARRVLERVPLGASADALARMNALLQLENLRTYDLVRRRLETGELRVYAWFYDIGRAEIESWDPEKGAFGPLQPSPRDAAEVGARAPVHEASAST